MMRKRLLLTIAVAVSIAACRDRSAVPRGYQFPTSGGNFATLSTIGTSSSPGALRGLVGYAGQLVQVVGFSNATDQGGGTFQWDTSSSTGDDGGTIVVPTGSSTGRWLRVIPNGALYNVKWWGCQGDGTTDDTACIQTALNQFACPYAHGTAGPLSGRQHTLYWPSGAYPISNTLQFEGNSSCGIRLLGEDGVLGGTQGSVITWIGGAGGTMMLALGINATTIDHLSFDPYGNSAVHPNGHAQNALWIDSTAGITETSYAISSISRSSGIVTATVGTHSFASPLIVKITGVTDASYNGTFRVMYTTSTTVSWMQNGANSSSSGGTAYKYASADAFFITLNHMVFANPEAVTTNVTSITGSFPTFTLTTATPHFLNVGDLIVYRNGSNPSAPSDATYETPYSVTAIGSSTTATLSAIIVMQDGAGTTGGNIQSDATGLRMGHAGTPSPGVGVITGRDLVFNGDFAGGSMVGIEADGGGNVKDFAFYNVSFNGLRYGAYGMDSGNLGFYFGVSACYTPDTTPALACIDFLQCGGQAHISAWEAEESNARLWYSSLPPGTSSLSMNAVDYAANAPTDDIIVVASQVTTIGGWYENGRTSSSVPFFQMPVFGNGSHGSLVSEGNFYTNAGSGGMSSAPGWIPVITGAAGTVFQSSGNGYETYEANITSIGDYGGTSSTGGTSQPLNNVTGAQTFAAFGNYATPLAGIAGTGVVRLPSTAAIKYRNNAASADYTLATTNTSDVLQVGDAPGVAVPSTHNSGSVSLSSGTATATVNAGAHCVCQDQTSAGTAVTCPPPGGTTVTFTGTGTDVISYLCF